MDRNRINTDNMTARRTAPAADARTADPRRAQPSRDPRGTAHDPRGAAPSQEKPAPGAGAPAADKKDKKYKTKFVKPHSIVRIRGGVDRPMLIIILVLLGFGLVMVFSASFAAAHKVLGDSFYYIKRQGAFAILGLIAMFAVSFFDYRFFRRFAPLLFVITLGLMVIAGVYGRARGVAARWIDLKIISIQPSEIMKLAIVLFFANYCATHREEINDYSDFRRSSIWGDIIPIGIIGVVGAAMVLQKHFSGLIILALIGMTVIFAGGARKFWFLLGGGIGAGVTLIFIMINDYAKKRIDVFLHPENYSKLNETWQTLNGLNAVGSGGLLGVGLGNSYMKYSYVSAPQNDFIFSIVCEELGFIGATALILLFVLFAWRGFVIAMRAPDTFSALTAFGITSKVIIQVILNIGVVTNVIPNTGIALPFFSYGGSALLIQLTEMGVLLAISRYSYKEE
ncbi:MAG: cell division protein FtsW [Clostridia bacterium]|nr:cell division protein FtsW [Clostridia bacterium]